MAMAIAAAVGVVGDVAGIAGSKLALLKSAGEAGTAERLPK